MMRQCQDRSDHALFLRPFSKEIWATLIAAFLFYTSILTFISFLGRRRSQSSSKPKDNFTFWESLSYFSLASIQLGPDKQPVSTGGKLLQQLWSILFLIMITTYTANLVALFSKNPCTKPLTTIDDILGSKFNASCFARYDTAEYRAMKNPILNKLLTDNRMKFFDSSNLSVEDERSFVQQHLQAQRVWIDKDANIDYLIDNDKGHKFFILEGYFFKFDYHFAMRKDWKLAGNLNQRLEEYVRSGIVEQITRKYRPRLMGQTDLLQPESTLQFQSFLGFFAMIFLGGFVAVLIAMVEFCCDKRKVG